GTILTTEDGGVTWVAREAQGAVTFFDVFFTDRSNGWAVGNAGALFQTSDGGREWSDHSLPCGKSCTKLVDLLQVRFTGPQVGWIVGDRGALYRTTDAGFTWVPETAIAPVSLFGLSFVGTGQGWAVGAKGAIVHLQPAR
ncbi:MAG: hypothetical protein LDL14_07410, partial [Nitrospira sp.]|nr:hypothetical protein [Nitrospira sp.]